MIKKLVDHLPSVGCKHCIKGDPPQPVAVHKLCVCEDLFLQPLANWRPAAKVWFARERRGNNWHQNVMKTISEEAKLSKIYTNGSIRASVVTELLAAGYDNRIIMELTGPRVMRWFKHIVDSWKGWTPWSTGRLTCCSTAPEEMP